MAKNQEPNEQDSSSKIIEDNLFKINTLRSQLNSLSDEILSTIVENNIKTSTNSSTSLIHIKKTLNNVTLDLSNCLNPKKSLSESDLFSTLHRNTNKEISNNQSDDDDDRTDDSFSIEWDKERNLFHNYINSLRKEIRVLLQERLDYQKTNKHIDDDQTQTKIDLLRKSLEEKNSVIERLQVEHELVKEKTNNSLRKLALLESDNRSYINIIDELKQNLADLTIDLQNQLLIKRRLEISINNLESNCQLIDAERIKLINDMKENQHNKQELETYLQKANVKIAEQGSTIEMLRSENVQVRSELSTMQRRMFLEKQQIIDYLHQIENDLIEKERIKQRELLLRQDYEQLKNSFYKDQEKLQNEYSQLLKVKDDEKIHLEFQLNSYKSEIERLYSHFNLNIDSIDQLIPTLDARYQSLKEFQNLTESTNKYEQLRTDFEKLAIQYEQLSEVNHACHQYQQSQIMILHDRFKLYNSNNDLSFEDAIQQIETKFHTLHDRCDLLFNQLSELQINSINQSGDRGVQSLQENFQLLTAQCTQSHKANCASQQFQLNQLENFKNKLKPYLSIENNASLDEIEELILDYLYRTTNERDILSEKLKEFQIHNRNTHTDLTIDTSDSMSTRLNQPIDNSDRNQGSYSPLISRDSNLHTHEILRNEYSIQNVMSVQMEDSLANNYETELSRLRKTNDILAHRCIQLDGVNRQWQHYEQQQIDNFQNKLQHSIQLDNRFPLNQIPEIILEQINKKQEEFDQKYEILQKKYDQLRSESEMNLETIKGSYANKIDDLSQELLVIKEQLNKQTNALSSIPLDQITLNQNISEVQNTLSWKEIIIEIFKNELEDYLLIDLNASFNKIMQHIADQIKKKQEDYRQCCETLEKTNHHLQLEFDHNMESIRQSYLNTINELNQELIILKEECEKFDQRKTELTIKNENLQRQLNDRSTVVGHQSAAEICLVEQQNLFENNNNKSEANYKPNKYHRTEDRIGTETIVFVDTIDRTNNNLVNVDDQQVRIESLKELSSFTDDENSFEYSYVNNQLHEYIDEISRLSSVTLVDILTKKCQEILSKTTHVKIIIDLTN